MRPRGLQLTLSRWRAAAVLGLLALAVVWVLRPSSAAAHPLGNFTVNHYSRLEFGDDSVRVLFVLDFAEIPTFQQMKQLDTDDDGALSVLEAGAYLDANLPGWVRNLDLRVGGDAIALEVLDRSAAFLPGQGGLPLLRVEGRLAGSLPDNWDRQGAATYADRNYLDRLGWREIVVRGGPGVALENSTVLTVNTSDELRAYPNDMLASPLDQSEATFTLVPGDGTPASDVASQTAAKITAEKRGGTATERVAALVTVRELTPGVILVSLLGAVFWGAAHALAPGHGKAIVAAYLVGSRGTARHAVFLGLTVTATHTIGVFALGLVTLYLSRYILPEVLFPWLTVISGAMVIAVGVSLTYNRLRGYRAARKEARNAGDGRLEHAHAGHDHHHHHDHGHAHDHSHDHGEHGHSHLPTGAAGQPVTWRSLLALGVSGGLIPCPSALVLLLASIAIDRLQFGMILVTAFSFGLAVVLAAVGIVLVYARRLFERFSFEARVPRLLPVAGSAAMSLAGLALVAGAIGNTAVV